jgi:dTDP-4-dehydrorhamnose 3,5-epimerase
MNFIPTEIPGVIIIEPAVIGDSRGYFFEAFKHSEFLSQIGAVSFVQDNQSHSIYGTVRGLHYQRTPHAQAKLVRVLAGRVMDVAVDMRKGSPTYGKHVAIELSAENKRQLFIPAGFAHGFSVLSPEAEFFYKVDNYWNREAEGGIIYNDPALGIEWGLPETDMLLADKDKALPLFTEAEHNFTYGTV